MSGLSLESVLLEYGASEVSAMEVYSDIFQLGDGFIQTEGEPGGLHKANPIILGSFGGHYDSDGKLVGDRRRRRILFEDTFEETLAEFRDANWAITNGLTYWGRANTANALTQITVDAIGQSGSHQRFRWIAAFGNSPDFLALY